MNFLEILKLAISLLPILHDAVASVETLFPQGGNGQKKLDMVKGILEQAMTAGGYASTAFSAVWPVASSLIASIVSMKKVVTGTSATSAPTAAPTPAPAPAPSFGFAPAASSDA